MDSKGRFTKGDKRAGRRTGSQNKVTKAVKEMIEGALHDLGGQAWLVKAAKKNPGAFMSLLAKILPKDIKVEGEVKHTLEQLVTQSLQQTRDEARPH